MEPRIISPTKGVKADDIIVAFMGPTGSGKSFFIDLLTGQTGRRAGNSLASVTKEIEATRMQLPGDPKGRDIVLVDTPGFDGTETSDMDILQVINKWLEKTYERNIKLSGLVYLHRITDNRMGGNPCKNVRMFGELCGELAMTQVVLVTTMWERVVPRIGEERQKELADIYWKSLVDRGSSIDRLKKATYEEAWAVVGAVVERRLRIEASEIVLLHEKLVNNPAGVTSYTDLHRQLVEQQEAMKSVMAQMEKTNDPHFRRELKKECKRIEREIKWTRKEAEELKLSTFKRIFSFLYSLLAGKNTVRMAKARRATS